MNYFESYLDEDLLNEDYFNEDLLNEDLLESYGESFDEARRTRRPSTRGIRPNVSSAVKQRSNFGKTLNGRAADYATKSELKKSLDEISSQVNELKKTTLATNKALVSLDQKHTDLAKIDVRKGDNQTKVLKNMQMMNMMGAFLNQPKLDTTKLKVVPGVGTGAPSTIEKVGTAEPITIDPMMSVLLPMMTTMGDSGSGKSDNMTAMIPLMLIMSQQGQNKDTNSTTTMMPLIMMMMLNK